MSEFIPTQAIRLLLSGLSVTYDIVSVTCDILHAKCHVLHVTCYIKALLSMGKQGTKSFARDFFLPQWFLFEKTFSSTLSCDITVHRAGSQLKTIIPTSDTHLSNN